MVIPVEIQAWYSANAERFAALDRRVRQIVNNFCSRNGYLYGSRVKSLDSVVEKIDLGRLSSVAALDDGCAGTIVVPSYSDEPKVLEFLQKAFVEKNLHRRGATRKAPDQFRFDATRFYGSISDQANATEVDRLIFEIQIQSAFDYAWQKITHDLVYKNETIDWRRARVASQMKALVEQLDAIGGNFEAFAAQISPSEWPEISTKNLILTRLDSAFQSGKLPLELKTQAPSRLAETLIAFLKSDGAAGQDLHARVVRSLDEIERFLDDTGIDNIPRSLTLAQLIFGVLYRRQILSSAVKHRILLNSAMIGEFPELKGYRHVVSFDI